MNLEENLLDRNAAALKDKLNNLSIALEASSNNNKQNIKRYLSDQAQVKSDVTINIPNPEEIKDLDVSPLVHSTTMESLHIRGKLHSKEKTTMTIETAQLIADILKNTHTLTDLKLDFDIIPAAEIKLIADALKNNTTVTDLNLDTVILDNEEYNYVADVFEESYTLTNLRVGNNMQYDSDAVKIMKSKEIRCEKLQETLKSIASGNTSEEPEEYIDALKFYQATNPVLLGFDKQQHNNINDYIQKNFFHLTAVCKDNPLVGDAIDGSVLPQHKWNEIFSYLKISDVVEPSLSGDSKDAIELSGITDDADVIGS